MDTFVSHSRFASFLIQWVFHQYRLLSNLNWQNTHYRVCLYHFTSETDRKKHRYDFHLLLNLTWFSLERCQQLFLLGSSQRRKFEYQLSYSVVSGIEIRHRYTQTIGKLRCNLKIRGMPTLFVMVDPTACGRRVHSCLYPQVHLGNATSFSGFSQTFW